MTKVVFKKFLFAKAPESPEQKTTTPLRVVGSIGKSKHGSGGASCHHPALDSQLRPKYLNVPQDRDNIVADKAP